MGLTTTALAGKLSKSKKFGKLKRLADKSKKKPTKSSGVKVSTDKKPRAAAAPPPPPSDPINDRFGHDMAWLDEQFQVDPALLGTSARSEVYADPALIAQQQQALDKLFGIAEDGGATAQERARRAAARRDSEGWLRGQREADMEDLRERGMSGSGAEILALGNDRQAAAQRNSAADLETDAWLEQRALDALFQGGQLAGQMRDTGFQEGQLRGNARDEFDVLNQQSINQANESNKQFQRQAWNEALGRRNDWDRMKLQLGLNTAGGLMQSDIQENQAGYNYGKNLAEGDTDRYNAARTEQNQYTMTPAQGVAEQRAIQDQAGSQATKNTIATGGEVFNTIAGGMGGGGSGMGSMPSFGGASGGQVFDEDEVWGR